MADLSFYLEHPTMVFVVLDEPLIAFEFLFGGLLGSHAIRLGFLVGS